MEGHSTCGASLLYPLTSYLSDSSSPSTEGEAGSVVDLSAWPSDAKSVMTYQPALALNGGGQRMTCMGWLLCTLNFPVVLIPMLGLLNRLCLRSSKPRRGSSLLSACILLLLSGALSHLGQAWHIRTPALQRFVAEGMCMSVMCVPCLLPVHG